MGGLCNRMKANAHRQLTVVIEPAPDLVLSAAAADLLRRLIEAAERRQDLKSALADPSAIAS